MSDTESNLHWGWLGLARETNITATHVPGSTLPQYSNPLACFQYHGQYRGTKYFAMDGPARGSHLYVLCRSGIKIESSSQRPFWEPIKGSKSSDQAHFFRWSKIVNVLTGNISDYPLSSGDNICFYGVQLTVSLCKLSGFGSGTPPLQTLLRSWKQNYFS